MTIKEEGYRPTDKLDTTNPPGWSDFRVRTCCDKAPEITRDEKRFRIHCTLCDSGIDYSIQDTKQGIRDWNIFKNSNSWPPFANDNFDPARRAVNFRHEWPGKEYGAPPQITFNCPCILPETTPMGANEKLPSINSCCGLPPVIHEFDYTIVIECSICSLCRSSSVHSKKSAIYSWNNNARSPKDLKTDKKRLEQIAMHILAGLDDNEILEYERYESQVQRAVRYAKELMKQVDNET